MRMMFSLIILLMTLILHVLGRGNLYGLQDLLDELRSPPYFHYQQSFLGPHLTLVHQNNDSQQHKPKFNFNCYKLHETQLASKNSPVTVIPAQCSVPASMKNDYTMGGAMVVIPWCLSDLGMDSQKPFDFSADEIHETLKMWPRCGGYEKPYCQQAIRKHIHLVKDKEGVVLGSQWPWAEAGLLVEGDAKHILTVEYRKITTDHPDLSTMTPFEFDEMYLNGSFKPVDFIFSYSSLEHDGLGRYGDPLNPFGDLESLARMHCMLKPGGTLFLGIPIGPDQLVYTAHRIYGKHRLNLILSLWEIEDIIGLEALPSDRSLMNNYRNQPVMVLRKHHHDHIGNATLRRRN